MTCAMFGIPFGAFQKSADANYFRRAAMWEVIRVANRLGVDIGQNEIDRQEHTIGRLPYQNKPSTLQDLEAGKFDSAMKNMSQKDAAKFQQVVNNPKIVEKLMNAPQAKALYEKLTGEKK